MVLPLASHCTVPASAYCLSCLLSHMITNYSPTHASCRSIAKINFYSLSEGFYSKTVSPDAAEFMAQYWSPATIPFPREIAVRYLRDTVAAFEVVGVYEEGNDKYPVSWSGRTTG